jgi:hypothetical protein
MNRQLALTKLPQNVHRLVKDHFRVEPTLLRGLGGHRPQLDVPGRGKAILQAL